MGDGETELGGPRRSFPETAWTRILDAREGSVATVRAALETLVEIYWKPVYFHIRRKGRSIEDAKDLTQQYFALFIQRGALLNLDPSRGKLRTFILTSLENVLSDDARRRKAKKRQAPLDVLKAEAQYSEDHSFEKDWALVVLDRAFSKLKDVAPREAAVVEAQRHGKTPHRELAERLETSVANIKVLAHRGRSRLRAIILAELRETVSRDGDEKEELAALFRTFAL